MPVPRSRLPLVFTLSALALPLLAQQGAIAFKHFRAYPAGQWRTEGQATRAGVPVGAPMTATTCSSPLSPGRVATLKNLGNSAAPACTMKLLADEELTAEYEQTCTGTAPHTTHTTMHAIDDRTVTLDIRSGVSGQEPIVIHQTAHYLGVCPAGEAAPTTTAGLPSVKPSPEDCAGVPEMKQQAQDSLNSCSNPDLPDNLRANCNTRAQAVVRAVAAMEQSCKQ